jgi:hypothetical protein
MSDTKENVIWDGEKNKGWLRVVQIGSLIAAVGLAGADFNENGLHFGHILHPDKWTGLDYGFMSYVVGFIATFARIVEIRKTS